MNAMQIGLLTASILMLAFVIFTVRKNKMNIHYSVIWIIWGISLVILSLFPSIISWASDVLSIATPTNTLFLIMIFFLYCLTLYIYLKISKHNEEIIALNYEIAVLKKKVTELESKK